MRQMESLVYFFGQDKKVLKGNIEGNFLFIFLAKTNRYKKMGL